MDTDAFINEIDDDEQISVTLPSNIIAQIDAQVGDEFVDREDFMLASTRHYLEYLQDRGNRQFMAG